MQVITKPKKLNDAVKTYQEVRLLAQKQLKALQGMSFEFFGSLDTSMGFAVSWNPKNAETFTPYELQKIWAD